MGGRRGSRTALSAVVLTLSFAVPATAAIAAGPTSATGPTPTPGLFSSREEQWYQQSLRLADAHQVSLGAGVIVAVIDGGVDATHPKLRGQLLPGAGIGTDAAVDGLRDDDPDGHGTAMAGIIAGRADVGDPAVWGVAPAAKVLPISTGVRADSDEVARGIRIAVDRGADVISMSLGSVGHATDAEERAVRYALERDVVVVASAGNTEPGDTAVNSPANIPGVIAVTGTDYRGRFWGGSVQGPQSVLAAPGPAIRVPVPTRVSEDGLDTGGGTSNSAAIVAGVAALVRAELPTLDAANVVNRLIRTATDMGPLGRDDQYGFGLVDPVAALTTEIPLVATNPLLATRSPGATAAGDATADSSAGGSAATGSLTAAPDDSVGLAPSKRSAGPSAALWILMLGLATVEGALLGALAHLLFGARYATMRERRRQRKATPVDPSWSPPGHAPAPRPAWPAVNPAWSTATAVRPAPTPVRQAPQTRARQAPAAARPEPAAHIVRPQTPQGRPTMPVRPVHQHPPAIRPRATTPPSAGRPVDTQPWKTPH
ncbi:type VII secretion-associated serine protease mycosin [Parafrankia irregularis]|uniref:Type VII secretion-associated serine protease mycosin n=1 Tax=Parafrankia irregularis TaxID=795642 RepID=A0A0S4QUL5_9ACTN|nr:S8 family serine peptidase [Parafrankia irregularis]MBE3205041.1 S8 family serine peptidase [Parafrankia sp. CH37]CUU58738.1 type VII secretion-associated serine protease mycosin [Parafrankia irregularis]